MTAVIPLLNILLLAALCFIYWKQMKTLRTLFWPALLFKVVCGILLGVIYLFYYQVGDTILYHEDASLLADIGRADFARYFKILVGSPTSVESWPQFKMQEPRAIILVKLASIIHLLTLNSYWVTGAYFSCLSFFGAWYFLTRLHDHLANTTPAAALSFLFLPSVALWSSGLIKESPAMASLFFLSGVVIRIWFSSKIRFWEWMLAIIAVWLLWNLKYYYAAVFFLTTTTTLLFRLISHRFFHKAPFTSEATIWLTILIIPLAFISFLHPNFYPHRFFTVIAENYNAYWKISDHEDVIHFFNIGPHLLSMVLNAPWACVSGLFRPFVWEAGNVLQWAAALENLLLLALTCVGLSRLPSIAHSQHRILIFAALVYIILLSVFITLSTPNFGTLSRYRTSYIPFFFYLLCCIRPVLTILQRYYHLFLRIER